MAAGVTLAGRAWTEIEAKVATKKKIVGDFILVTTGSIQALLLE